MGGNYPLEFVAIMSQVSGVTFYLSKSRREVEDHSVSDKLFLPSSGRRGRACATIVPPFHMPASSSSPLSAAAVLRAFFTPSPPLPLAYARTGWRVGEGGKRRGGGKGTLSAVAYRISPCAQSRSKA